MEPVWLKCFVLTEFRMGNSTSLQFSNTPKCLVRNSMSNMSIRFLDI